MATDEMGLYTRDLDRNSQPVDENGLYQTDRRGRTSSYKPQVSDYNSGESIPYVSVDKYDFPVFQGHDIDERRAQEQSGLGLVGKSIWNTAVEIGVGTMEAIGYLGDWQDVFDKSAAKEDGFSNAWSDTFKKVKEAAKTDIYQTHAATDDEFWNNLTDATWWASNAESIGTTLTLMVPSLGAVKGLEMLGEALGGAKAIKSIATANKIKGVAGAVISRKMESVMEAQQTFDQTYQDALSKGVDEGQARTIAGEAAAKNYQYNWLMLAQDLPQYMFLAGAFKNAKKAMPKTSVAFGLAGESAEEFYQGSSSQEAQFQAERKAGLDKSNKTFGDRVSEYLTDESNWSAAFWGLAGAGVYEGVGAYQDKKREKAFKEKTESFKKLMSENDLAYDTPEAFNKMQDAQFTSLLSNAFAHGTLDSVKETLTRMKDEDNEVIESSSTTDPKDFRSNMAKRLAEFEDFQNTAKQVADDATLPNNLKNYKFTTLVAQKYAETQLKDINNQLLAKHADDAMLLDYDLQELKKAKFAVLAAQVNPKEKKNLKELENKLEQAYTTTLLNNPEYGSRKALDLAMRTSNDEDLFTLTYYTQITHAQLKEIKDELGKLDTKDGQAQIESKLDKIYKEREKKEKEKEKEAAKSKDIIEKQGTGEKYTLVEEQQTPDGDRIFTVIDNDGNASQVKESEGYIKKGENKIPFDARVTREALESPHLFKHPFLYRPDRLPTKSVENLVDKIENGGQATSPEELQLYDNYKKIIEAHLLYRQIINSPNWKDRLTIRVSKSYVQNRTVSTVSRVNPNKSIGILDRTDIDIKLFWDNIPLFDLHNPNKFADKTNNEKPVDFSQMKPSEFYSKFFFGKSDGSEHPGKQTGESFETLQDDWKALKAFNDAVVVWYKQQNITDPTKWVELPKEAVTSFLTGQLDLVRVDGDRQTLDQIPAFNINGTIVVWDNKQQKFISGEEEGTKVFNSGYAPDSILGNEKSSFNGKVALAVLPNGIKKWIKISPKTLRGVDSESFVSDIQETILELKSLGIEKKDNNIYKEIADTLNNKYFIAGNPGWSIWFHVVPAHVEKNKEATLSISISQDGQERKATSIYLRGVESMDDLIKQLNGPYNKSGIVFKKTSFKSNTEEEAEFDPKQYESTVAPNIITKPNLNFTYHPDVLIKATGGVTNILPWDQKGTALNDESDFSQVPDDVDPDDINYEDFAEAYEGGESGLSNLEALRTKKEEVANGDKNQQIINESLKKGVNEDEDNPFMFISDEVPTIDNRIDYNASLEYLRSILPSFIKVREMEEKVAQMVKYGIPFGALYQNAIYLSKNAPLGTEYHEAFHAVFRNFLNDTQINAVLKSQTASDKEMDELAFRVPKYRKYSRQQLSDLVKEEKIAEKYKEWKLAKGNEKSSLLRTIFDRIQRIIDWIISPFNSDKLTPLFRKIDAGVFRNSKIKSNQFNTLGTEPVFTLLGPLGARESQVIINTIAGKLIRAKAVNKKADIQDIINQQIAFNDPTAYSNRDIVADPEAANRLDLIWKIYKTPAIQDLIVQEVVKKLNYLGYSSSKSNFNQFVDDEHSERNFDINEWEYNPYDKVNAEVKAFIATTLVDDVDEFGRKYQRAVNDYQVYSSMSILLAGKKQSEMIPTLEKFTSYNQPDRLAVLKRIKTETGWSLENPLGDGSLKANQQLVRFYKAFERRKINWSHTENHKERGLISYEAQRNKLEDTIINDWHKNYQSLSINKQQFANDISNFKKKKNNPNLDVKGWDNRKNLYKALSEILNNVGIELTQDFIEASYDQNNRISPDDLALAINDDQLDVLVDKVLAGYNPFIGETESGEDFGMLSYLKGWATSDLNFREDFFIKSFQDAEGKNRFSLTIPSYALVRSDEIREKFTKKSDIEFQKANDFEFALNSLIQGKTLDDIIATFQNAELTVLGDYSNTKDKSGYTAKEDGVTYKDATDTTLLLSVLSNFITDRAETIKGKEYVYTTYPLGVNETKKAFFGVKLTVDKTLYSNGVISDKALETIFNSIFVGEVTILNSAKRLANRNFTYLPIFDKNFLENTLKAELADDGSIIKINNTDFASYKDTVKGMIKEYMEKEISEFKDILKTFNIENALYKNRKQLDTHGSYDSMVGNFVLNNFINVTGYNQLLSGDAKLSKNFVDWVKRNAGKVAFSQSQEGRTIKYVVVTDSLYEGDKNIPDDRPANKKLSDDGQVGGTIDHLIEFHRTQGTLEGKLEIFEKIKNPPVNKKNRTVWEPSIEELAAVDLISIKDVTYGPNLDNDLVYFKDSTVIYTKLMDSFYNFNTDKWEAIPGKEAWRNKREFMEKNGIHQAIPLSVIKSLKPATDDILSHTFFHGTEKDFQKKVKDKTLMDLGVSLFGVDGKYQGLQLDNYTKPSDLSILGTQLQALIDSELNNPELRARYHDALNKIHQTAFKLAVSQLVTENYDKAPNITKWLQTVRDTMEETTPDLHMLHFLKAANGDMLGDPNLPHIMKKFQQYFLAHFTKVLKTKFTGDKKTIVASNDYNVVYDTANQRVIPSEELIQRINDGETFPEDKYPRQRLQVRFKENGDIDYFEIATTKRNAQLMGFRIGKIIEMDPKLVEGIGIRIPTASHQNMMRYKIVEYIPEYYGSTILTPHERTHLSGEDHDVDSIFTYRYDSYLDKKGHPVLFGTAKTPEKKWEEFKAYQLLRNKDLRKSYASNEEVLIEMLKGDIPALKEIGMPSNFQEYMAAGQPDNIGALQNEVLDIYQEMLQSPELQESMKTATSVDRMEAIADRIFVDLRGKSKTADSFSTLTGLYNSWKNITTGSKNIGISALGNTTGATLTKYKVNLKPGFELSFGKDEKGNEIIYSTFDTNAKDTRQKNADIAMIINVMVDNGKNPIAFYANLAEETFGLFTPMLSLGVPLETAALFMNQPIMDEYIHRVRVGEKKFEVLGDLKARYSPFEDDKGNKQSLNVSQEELEWAIQNNRIKEALSKQDKDKLHEIQLRVFNQMLKIDAISQNFQQASSVLSLNKGFGTDFESLDKVSNAMHKLDLTNKLTAYERKTNLTFDFNKAIQQNNLIKGNIEIFKNVTKASKNYTLRTTDFYNQIFDRLRKSLKSRIKQEKIEQTKNDLQTYLSMKAFIKQFGIDTEKHNKLLKEGDNSIAKQFKTLLSKEEFRKNRFIQWLKAKPIHVEQGGEIVTNPYNKTNLEIIEADSRLKINPEINENIINAFEHLQRTTDPEIKAFMKNLIPYLLVKDNLTFRNNSFIRFISPSMFADEGKVLSLANVMKELNIILKNNDLEKLREFTGLTSDQLTKEFIEVYSRHVKNGYNLKSIYTAADPNSNAYKVGKNSIYLAEANANSLKITLSDKIKHVAQLGGNSTFNVEENKNGYIKNVEFPDFFVSVYYDQITGETDRTFYKLIKSSDKSAEYQKTTQFGSFYQMPYHMTVEQLEKEKAEKLAATEPFGDYSLLTDDYESMSEDFEGTDFSGDSTLSDMIGEDAPNNIDNLRASPASSFSDFQQMTDKDLNEFDGIDPLEDCK